MSNYDKRKMQEVRLLNQYVAGDYILDKEKLVTQIKSCEVLKKDIFLSNRGKSKICFGKNTLEYSYLRFKNNYVIFNEEKLIGLEYSGCFYHKTFYFNSGMSAVTTIIESIQSLKKIRIKYSDKIYFETYKLLQQNEKSRCGFYFLYYDAIEPDFSIDTIIKMKFKKKCLGVIVDTTCLTGTRIEELVNICIKHNKFIFLVKSLTKLDMLGTEYSHLGSLTLLVPKQLNKKEVSIYQNIYVRVVKKMINYGCSPCPIDFPPFWDDDDFYKLNTERISKIKINTDLVYNKIKNFHKISVIKPNHKLFLIIYPCKNYNREKLIEICEKIKTILCCKYDIRCCGSFGFDFISLDTYINVADNKETIRLALNDYDENTIINFSKEFVEAVNDCI